jgi:hypothetical protein
MIKISQKKSEWHEEHEIVFWDEETQKTVSPSLVMSLLMNNQMKVIRKFTSFHHPDYMTFLDYDFYIVPKEK